MRKMTKLGLLHCFVTACFVWAIPDYVPVYQKVLMGVIWPAFTLVRLFEKLFS